MRNGLVAVVAAVAMAAGAGLSWGVGHFSNPAPSAPIAAPAMPVQAPLPAKPGPAVVAAKAEAVVSELENVPAGQLRFRRLDAETGGDSAEACLVFSAALDGGGVVRYADYVTVPAPVKAGLRVDGKRLCLSGFSFGSETQVTLRRGLPGAGGEKLPEDVAVTIGFDDRPASVSFGPGFVLPKDSVDGLPVTTVNVSRLDLKVYRVGDRLLARMRQDLVDERRIYPYAEREMGDDQGRLVWSGSMPVTGPRNDAVVSLFPLAEAVGRAEPGAYLVVARNPDSRRDDGEGAGDDDADDYRPAAAQWVVQSDLGLTSFSGADGLNVFVRSLASAKPAAGIRLTLIARNNDVLAELTTGPDGRARFDAGLLQGGGGLAPVMVMAYGVGDFNVLDLRRPDFDLSDRGVDGRDPAGPVDAFVYAERGIYRPGETVHLVSLLRDPGVHAIAGRDWTIKVSRPDGKEYRRFAVHDQGGGAAALDIALPAAAARGQWEATVHADPEGPAVGRLAFEVQDFVPQRLGLTMGERPLVLRAGEALAVGVEARFLYGAVAAGLEGEAELTIEPDPAPYPAFAGYRWGLADAKFEGVRQPLAMAATDAAGRTTVEGMLPKAVASTLPLRADISIALREPGGRATAEHVRLPFRLAPLALGIHPLFDGSVGEGQAARFEVIAVDADGKRVAHPGLRYRILKDVSTWQWFRSGARWHYQKVAREVEIAAGDLTVGADAPALIAQTVGWGGYRLLVGDKDSGAASSVVFSAGWYGNAGADRPDRLKVAADKPGYRAGDVAQLHVDSDSGGEALLVVAGERVQETRTITIPPGGGDVAVTIGADWGPGAYALVTLYRPVGPQLGHTPVRAVGLAWLGLDPAPRSLAVAIDAPARITPRQVLNVPVTVSGAKGSAFVTLAAVDQGILQLTHFVPPSPQAHYLGKRRLGVGMRDDYGRLIRGLSGQGDDQGGDSFGGKGLDVVPTRTVALFSGIVPTGADGRARIALDIPDFQGELRLMAVAFDADKVGSADSRLTVRDPVVAEVILPRFLAPGDQGGATVLVHNIDGAEGEYRVALAAGGVVTGGQPERVLSLPKGRREVFTVPLAGRDAGLGQVDLTVDGPEGLHLARSWPIQVRAAQLPVTRQDVRALAAGQSTSLGHDLLDGFLPGTGAVALSVSRWQGLDVPGLLRWLDRYPFGCLEQTTSRAMPLLYFNDIALLAGKAGDATIASRVQDAVERLVSMQDGDGEFRMWGGWGGAADPWLSAFALDFLDRSAERGFDVPKATMEAGRRWLKRVSVDSSDDNVRAYAAAILARKGLVNVGDLRYFFDQKRPAGALALAHLGTALDAVGERARAADAFDAARAALAEEARMTREIQVTPVWGAKTDEIRGQLERRIGHYGSVLRDTYGVAAQLAATGRGAQVPAALAAPGPQDSRVELTTTQEKAWMLLAAAAMAGNGATLAAELDGRPLPKGDPVAVPVGSTELDHGASVRNAGDADLFAVVSAEGVPAQPLAAASAGMTVTKSLYSLDGAPVDPAAIRRNDRLVVVVDASATEHVSGDYAVLDLLPAGWEIEGVLRPEQPGFAWVGRLSEAQMRQARDDRFVAAVALPDYQMDRSDPDMPQRKYDSASWNARVAYSVRAVTPGTFALPAARVEHMYVPRIAARTAMGQVVIAE